MNAISFSVQEAQVRLVGSARVSLLERTYATLVMVLSTGGFVRFLEGQPDPYSGAWHGGSVTNAMWAMAYAFALIMVWRHRRILRGLLASWPMLLPIPIALASVFWSQDRITTLMHLVALTGTTAIAIYFAARFTTREILVMLVQAAGILAISSAFLVVFFPGYGLGTGPYRGDWLGVFEQKNALARPMAVGVVVCLLLWRFARYSRVRWLLTALAFFAVILLSDSVASAVDCLATALAVWLTSIAVSHSNHMWKGWARVTIFGALAAVFLSLNLTQVLAAVGRNQTLTGRTALWFAIWPKVMQRPILGWGYEAFWIGYQGPSGEVWEQMGQNLYYSHNGILEIWLGEGLVGAGAMVFSLYAFGRRAWHYIHQKWTLITVWPWIWLAYLVTSNLVEGNLMKANNLEWLLYIWTALLLGAKTVPPKSVRVLRIAA